MDAISGSGGGGGLDASSVYDVAMLRRAQDLQRMVGANAQKLIDAAAVRPPQQQERPLPPDATISIRV